LDPDRVKEIQQALTREGYLQGDPTGEWDANTRGAMLRYQTMHGFPPTGLPEAKSLMKMGLGPHPLAPELDHGQVGVATGSVITPVQNVFSVSSTNPPNPAPPRAAPDPISSDKK
jgi:peptidoglycan hydrolase-like protein with peptidoglycan-binding domain